MVWMGSAGIKKMFEDAVEDENTKAIVLRVNSGGGLSISADYMRMAIQKAKDKGIPLVTSMGFSSIRWLLDFFTCRKNLC